MEVPNDSFVTFFGGAQLYIPDTTTGDPYAENYVWGAIFETTDSSDPFYTGIQCYHTYKIGGAAAGLIQTPSWGHDLELNPNSETGALPLEPWTYRPQPGNRTYRMDFRRTCEYPADKVFIDHCWFGVEVT